MRLTEYEKRNLACWNKPGEWEEKQLWLAIARIVQRKIDQGRRKTARAKLKLAQQAVSIILKEIGDGKQRRGV